MKRLRRLRDAWLAAPEVLRLMLLMLVLFSLAFLTGCTVTGGGVSLLHQDENSCSANPKAMPGCIVGLKVSIDISY